jgi:hypothetical protein
VLSDANYIIGQDADTRVALGAFLVVLLAISGIATAVVLFPILKRQSEAVEMDASSTMVGPDHGGGRAGTQSSLLQPDQVGEYLLPLGSASERVVPALAGCVQAKPG